MMEDNDTQKRLHAVVDGRVQGVGFRAFVLRVGSAMGACGWVRNRWDGTVEVVAEGTEELLQRLLGELRVGPRSAVVTDIKIEWQPATSEFTSFGIRRTE